MDELHENAVGPQYPLNKYAVQPKGWLDSTTYKQWVREVLLPYMDGRDGYLIQVGFQFIRRKTTS
jgi:hypothetical protein